jgi:hypothetical protein
MCEIIVLGPIADHKFLSKGLKMNRQEKKKWLAYRRAQESARLSALDSVEDTVEDGVAPVMGNGSAVFYKVLERKGDHTVFAPLSHNTPDNTPPKSPDMRFDITDESNYLSPEGTLWTREAHKDMSLVRLLARVRTLSDSEKRGAYNLLVHLTNTAPLYFRDSVFAIAWEKHHRNLGKRGIVRELASTLWMIKHLRLYGFSAQYAIERLQGVLKTNKLDSMFHSETIDSMINNYESETQHNEEHVVKESDYAPTFGTAVDPAQIDNGSNGVVIPLNRQLELEIHAYIAGLSKLIQARIERYADMGVYVFISNGITKSDIKGLDNFTNRLFHGYIKHTGLDMSDFDGILSKRMFLMYVYTYYRPIDVEGITAHYTDSINLSRGRLAHMLVQAEKASREAGEAMGAIAVEVPEAPKAPAAPRKAIVDGRVSKAERPLLRNYRYENTGAVEVADPRAVYDIHWGDRRNW